MSQEEYKRRLRVLMNKPENQICSDCPERQPRWASLIVPPPGAPAGSIPIGAFCCLECSGSHRRLGVHISFVRSINLDSWKEKEVLAMENGGNAKVNAIFEARLEHFGTHAGKPDTHADGRTRERFIRDKYERRKFYDATAFDRLQSASPDEEDSSSEDEAPKTRKNAGGKIAPLRAPSDAAKKRAESRRQKHLGKKTTKKPSAPAPAPAAPEIDLLDFSDFSSAPVETPAPPSPVRVPPSQPPPPPPPDNDAAPALDLFASMTVSQDNGDGTEDKTSFFAVASSAPAPAAEPPVPETKKVLNNDQIMSMFNSAPAQNQMGYGGFGGMTNMAMGNGMAGGMMGNNMMGNNVMANPMMAQQNMMMMPQQQPQQNNNNMMAFMGQSNQGMNVQMQMQMQQQQQQKVRMAMMMQQQKQQVPQQMSGQYGAGGGGQGGMNQQHIAMMNQLQMGNSGMMMMASSGPAGDRNKQVGQQMNFFQHQPNQANNMSFFQQQPNQATGMNGFGF